MTAVLLFAVGMALSALYSGAETGFYRVTRVRLLIEALAGDWIARAMLWTTNHPSVFVATTLVGNNLANYLVSFSIVLGTQRMFSGGSQTAEIVAPLVLAPLVFIYGELLPKRLFFEAPNRLLRRCRLPLLASGALFMPITAMLWTVNQLLQRVVRHSPQEIQFTLARRELARVLEEGHSAGILRPTQQALVQATFAVGPRPVREFTIPSGRYARATTKMTRPEVLRLARRQRRTLIPVEEPSGRRELVGYLRVVDLALASGDELPKLMPLVEISEQETHLIALTRLLAADHALGRVVSTAGQTVGFVTPQQLSESMFGNE